MASTVRVKQKRDILGKVKGRAQIKKKYSKVKLQKSR